MAEGKLKRLHIDLRKGDILKIAGAQIHLEKKKGQAARVMVLAQADTEVKKVPRASRPVPSLP